MVMNELEELKSNLIKLYRAFVTTQTLLIKTTKEVTHLDQLSTSITEICKKNFGVYELGLIKDIVGEELQLQINYFDEFESGSGFLDSTKGSNVSIKQINDGSKNNMVYVWYKSDLSNYDITGPGNGNMNGFSNNGATKRFKSGRYSKNKSSKKNENVIEIVKKRILEFDSKIQKWIETKRIKDSISTNSLYCISKEHLPVRDNLLVRNKENKINTNNEELGSNETKNEKMDFIDELKTTNFYCGQIINNGIIDIKERQPVYSTTHINNYIIESIKNCFGIDQLYSHQSDSIEAIDQGKNLVVTTNTASGKSLIFQYATVKTLLQTCHPYSTSNGCETNDSRESNSGGTVLILFPYKALSQNQFKSMKKLIENFPELQGMYVDIYDGDTLQNQRKIIPDRVNILLTNPDTLHCSILPNKRRWMRFLGNLKMVIIDGEFRLVSLKII
ncbi:hypothetical protein BB559_007379 [Furculomyces boomerangus]|uniref:Helicase ATP-binding domain-containing protein n=1 Tax=Furculomyces boomerangus TaxID=61424 RepID=A0A2T9XXL2_9FUNG|nr:hypothetical protein BB559_007379 [Furculomyces boomerangus]